LILSNAREISSEHVWDCRIRPQQIIDLGDRIAALTTFVGRGRAAAGQQLGLSDYRWVWLGLTEGE
jgi:hypothetical protein